MAEVVTISRQMGSLGVAVAEAAAQKMGCRVFARALINQAALAARAPQAALAAIDELNLLGMRPSAAEVKAYHEAVRDLMWQLAGEGNVILVGRAGQVILRDFPGVLHVRLYAPAEVRLARLAARLNCSPQDAQIHLENGDRARARYLRRYYHVRWDDPHLYDLQINTAHFCADDAVEIICAAAHHKTDVPG